MIAETAASHDAATSNQSATGLLPQSGNSGVDPVESANLEAEGLENILDILVTNLQSSKRLQPCKEVTRIDMEDFLLPLSASPKKNQTVSLKHSCQHLEFQNKQRVQFISGAQTCSKSHGEVASSHQNEPVPPPPQFKSRKRREKKNIKTVNVSAPPLPTHTPDSQRWHRSCPISLFSPIQVATASFSTGSGPSLTVKVLYLSACYTAVVQHGKFQVTTKTVK